MIYLDNSATTQPFPEVLESFYKGSTDFFANPSSIHQLGSRSEKLLSEARKQAARYLNVNETEVVFTSGGTEGNNLAIKGAAFMHQTRGKHIITSQVEHPSVLEACRSLETLGYEVSYVKVNEEGRVNLEDIKEEIREDTILVSLMSVNNELGTIQPIEEVANLLSSYPKILFHVDHVQGLGKVPIDIGNRGIDLCTLSGHKIHGLKGTGALIAKQHVSLFPLFHGGGQEKAQRSGTENLPGTTAFVKALRLIEELHSKEAEQLQSLHDQLYSSLQQIEKVKLNSPINGAPHIVNFSVPGYKPEVIIHSLGEREIYISTKSACSSKQPEVSSVLQACHLDRERTTSALRVSLSYLTTREEITRFIAAFHEVLEELEETMGRSL
ncbi:cysteine desulfurase [Halobacillus salinarum]|uniref:Cysteine desulfurase n=1 Tax=Halobacillus salinarum TaxID=2932257 RepID=A0ABY4ER21_9BACI|nr:cysteine desulfurase family protein [Halobacillus salinarum]UOQ46142.1 cysteine desulfurase [Halobacillus salinarum]